MNFKLGISFISLSFMACQLFAQDNKQVMSAAYNAIWNEQVQEQIDDRIEKFRKVDASIRFSDIKKEFHCKSGTAKT